MPLKIEIESFDRKRSAWRRARRKSQTITELWIRPNIRINGLAWPSAALPSQQTMELSTFWLVSITLNSTILTLISEGKEMNPSPALDHLGGVALVHLTKTRPRRSHVIRSLFTKEPAWSDGGWESCCDVDNSLKRFWEIEKSGSERADRLVLTEEERLALNKVSVPWKDEKPELPDTKPKALAHLRSTERSLKKDDRVAEDYKATIQASSCQTTYGICHFSQ